jgi:hypothetical protein
MLAESGGHVNQQRAGAWVNRSRSRCGSVRRLHQLEPRLADAIGIDMSRGPNLAGFSVEAADGGIGKIDEATYDASQSYLVVDTGPWIFGKKVLLPAGVIDRVDLDTETVFVNRSKDEIKNAPEFDESRYRDDAYRAELGGYYGGV